MTIGQMIAKWRDDARRTVQWTADRVGVHRRTYQNWVADKVIPRLDEFAKLVRVLDVPDEEWIAAIRYLNTSTLDGGQ